MHQLPPSEQGTWLKSLNAFTSRLRWHCHFIQKLEDEPDIEYVNLHPAYNGLRENAFSISHFEAWCTGHTGFPIIDACMRALQATGWLNFRMRAMLMSFASYQLWFPWQQPALHLARLFVDYEPGIHYSQCQMQAGTTGINSVRIYNPIKQGIEHDPDALFIRQWVPELRNVSPAYIHNLEALQSLSLDYPSPIVNEVEARKKAADIVFAMRQDPEHKKIADVIIDKHGSRRSGLRRKMTKRKKKKPPENPTNQLTLPF